MQKLKLQLDELRVDSFETSKVREDKGTVCGAQCTCQTVCTCPGCATCDASCNGSCDDFSCHPSGCGDFPSCQGGSCVSACNCPDVH